MSAPFTVVVLQPGYLPWLGFFDQVQRSDVFVYYDDIQFDKHGWRNRNRIKGTNGEPQWLSVPIAQKGLLQKTILEVEIDNHLRWAEKQLKSIHHAYARAPYYKLYAPQLEELLRRPWQRILDLDIAMTDLMFELLGMAPRLERASELGIQGGQSERLVNLCTHLGASRYLSGNAAKSYLDLELFARNQIEVVWQDYQHPTYPQQHGQFVPSLSTLDLLLNCGPDSAEIIASGSPTD